MNILIAPDSFKESLSAKEVGACIENGFRAIYPDLTASIVPLADGGEGTVEVLLDGLDGEMQRLEVTGPYGEKVMAHFALLDKGRTALIEIAAASGLDLTEPNARDPRIATSYGTGEIIKHVLDLGVDKIILGLGGSATNDGGAGIFQALGGKLYDASQNELSVGGAPLASLASIDISEIHPRCQAVEFVLACDVSNPLVGPKGASYIFGKQKGADPSMIAELDAALSHFADVCAQVTGKQTHQATSFGAAGGAPQGLSLAFDLQIKPGIDMVLDTLKVDQKLVGVDLVITGEGQMDNQTIHGKTPYGIAKRAKDKGIPVIGIAGSLGEEVDDLYSKIDAVFGTVRSPQALTQVLAEAEANLTRTARNIAASIKLGQGLNAS